MDIVDPKAHGLGYLFPPKIRKNEDEQDWSFEAWEWILRQVHGLKRKAPAWLDLPAMMRLVLSTPVVLSRFNDAIRPFNFLLCPIIDTVAGYPANVDPNRFTLVASFTPKPDRWFRLECLNVHNGERYRLSLRQTRNLDKVIPQTFRYILRLYTKHPESKSLGPDGAICNGDTWGLLQRAVVNAGQPRYLGKETDTRWSAGEDLSLLEFEAAEFRKLGGMVAAEETIRARIAEYGIRKLIRETGLSQHTIEAIQSGKTVRIRTLACVEHALQAGLQPL